MSELQKILFLQWPVSVFILNYFCNCEDTITSKPGTNSSKISDFYNMNWDSKNISKSEILRNLTRGPFKMWSPIKSEMNTDVQFSNEGISIQRQPYVPDTLPILNYDAQKNIVLNLYCVRGNDNKLIDAGKGKVCAQILAPLYDDALDAELHRFLSGVLQVPREDINVTFIGSENERKVTVAGKSISGGVALERLLEVLESPV
uniref:Uncharacterized protein n=1 Tax=Clastoptera arizonana TaxID=38151 RepID=A0A1B6D434_9HEMI